MRWSACSLTLGVAVVTAPSLRAGDDPDTEVAKRLFREGSAAYLGGRYEEALVSFTRARLAKPLPAFDYNIGRCHDRLGRWAEALAAYERYLAGAPDARDLDEVRARLPVLRERVRTADQLAQADAHHRRAIALFNEGAWLPAAEAFKQAHDAAPDPMYLYGRAQALRLAGARAEAARAYEAYLERAPGSPQRAQVEAHLRALKDASPSGLAPVPPPPGRPPAAGGAASGSERLGPVVALVKAQRAGFRACFDAWSARHPGQGGKVTLTLLLDPDGAVAEPKAEAAGFDAPEVAACVVAFARTLTYPAAANGRYTRFTYPFDFKPR